MSIDNLNVCFSPEMYGKKGMNGYLESEANLELKVVYKYMCIMHICVYSKDISTALLKVYVLKNNFESL